MKKNFLKVACFCLAIAAAVGGVFSIIEQNTYTGLSNTNICQSGQTSLETDGLSSTNQTNCALLTGQIDTINNRFAKLEVIIFFSFAATFAALGCLEVKHK